VQREIHPMSDYWQQGEWCTCGGHLKVTNVGHFEILESQVLAVCEVCGDGWRIEQTKFRVYVNPDGRAAK
jgi:hypothetical protein